MGAMFVFQIIFLVILVLVIFAIIRVSITLKHNDRINKYTVTKLNNSRVTIGDKVVSVYYRFRERIVRFLEKSVYFKKKEKRYEKFDYIDNPMNIIATKFCIAILFFIGYFISSIYKSNFNFAFMLLFMIIGYFVLDIYLYFNQKIRNKHIEADLLKAIMIMNNAFKSGYNIIQGIDVVSKDLNGPISEEFSKISSYLNYGLEIKDAFERFYDRVNIPDARYIISSLSLINITGGNLVGIFDSIEKSFTNKKRIKDELNSMTSSSKLVFYILLIMPVLIVSLLLLLSPDYYSPLFKNPFGIFIILFSLILYVGYIFIIRKILKVDL